MQKKVICLRDDDDLGYFTLTSHCTEGFPGGASGKEPTCQCRRRVRDTGPIPGSGKVPWRRAWQTFSVFLPEKFHGQRSWAGYSPWGHKESDTTEAT